MLNTILKEAEDKMSKSVENTKERFSHTRAGRANVSMLDGVTIEAYGAPTPLNQVGTISAPEARLLVPELTEDRRKEYVKMVKKEAEEGKIAIRNIRKDVNNKLRKLEKDSEITEDELKTNEEKVQKTTDKYIAAIDTALAAKEKELLTV